MDLHHEKPNFEFSTDHPDELMVRSAIANGLDWHIYLNDQSPGDYSPQERAGVERDMTPRVLEEIEQLEKDALFVGGCAMLDAAKTLKCLGGEEHVRKVHGDNFAEYLLEMIEDQRS